MLGAYLLAGFGRDVAGHAGHAAGFVLGALQYHLNAVTFFGHGLEC